MESGHDVAQLLQGRMENEEKVDMIKRSMQRRVKLRLEEQKLQNSLPAANNAANNNAGAVARPSPDRLGLRDRHGQPGFSQVFHAPMPRERSARGLSGSGFFVGPRMTPEDVEVRVMRQFQDKIFQLDARTRMDLQKSLYRLATSVEQRQQAMRRSNENSAELNLETMMDFDLDSCLTGDRSSATQQLRGETETPTNPVDRLVAHMLFSPLCLPGQKYAPQHSPASWKNSKPANQGQWVWSTAGGLTANNRESAAPALASRHHRVTIPQKAPTESNVADHTIWTNAPLLTDYASPTAASSTSVATSRFSDRQDNLASTAAATMFMTGGYPPTPPLEVLQARRSRASPSSSMTTTESYSSGQVQVFNFASGFDDPSSYGSQGSFVSGGQQADSSTPAMEQQIPNQSFGLMNVNEDILGAALSIQSRSTQISSGTDLFDPPSPNQTKITAGFPPLQYEGGSHFSQIPNNAGSTVGHTPTGMGYFDQKSNTQFVDILDSLPAYTPQQLL